MGRCKDISLIQTYHGRVYNKLQLRIHIHHCQISREKFKGSLNKRDVTLDVHV